MQIASEQVIDGLAEWILYTVARKKLATPEALEALPKVAEVYLKYVYSGSAVSPTKKS